VTRTHTTIQAHLKRYLEAEALLNAFFAAFDYCTDQCVKPLLAQSGNRPVAACCTQPYHCICDLDHPAYDRLRQERQKRFGKPEDHRWVEPVSPCQYHNPLKGCILSTHKSPICLAFFCRKAIDCLRGRFGIYTYDYLGMYYALEWILTGDLTDSQYVDFRKSIVEMTAKVKAAERLTAHS
jgi:hypothetical protein